MCYRKYLAIFMKYFTVM